MTLTTATDARAWVSSEKIINSLSALEGAAIPDDVEELLKRADAAARVEYSAEIAFNDGNGLRFLKECTVDTTERTLLRSHGRAADLLALARAADDGQVLLSSADVSFIETDWTDRHEQLVERLRRQAEGLIKQCFENAERRMKNTTRGGYNKSMLLIAAIVVIPSALALLTLAVGG